MDKTSSKSSNIWVADFETEAEPFYNKYGFTKTWLCYVENLHSEESFMCVDTEVFIEYVQKQFRKQRKSQFVYFHNLSFDGLFIMYTLNKMNIEFESVVNDKHKIYEIKIWNGNKKRYISFRCSLMIFMVSVSKLPMSTKSVIDYKKIRNYKSVKEATDEEVHYIKQDVRTVKYNLLELEKKFDVNLGGRFKTNASISYKELKRLTSINLRKRGFAWEDLMPKLSFEIDSYIRDGYRGGLTFLNPKWKGVEINAPVISYDINSSYPHRQRNDWLPFGEPTIKTELSDEDVEKDLLYMIRLKVYEARVIEPFMPFIATERVHRYLLDDIYPNEFESTVITLTSIDYELFKKYYHSDYEILDYCVFPNKAKGVFNEYIDKHYSVKSDGKEELEELKKLEKPTESERKRIDDLKFYIFISKLRINSAYGKFGTNPKIVSAIPKFEDGKLCWDKEEEVREDNIFYLPVATFITAYARRDIVEAIQNNVDRFIYTDTDSIKLLGVEEPNYIDIGKGLGQWDYEYTAEKSKFLASKRYIHIIDGKMKWTVAGMSKTEHKRITFDNFEIGKVFLGGKKKAKSVIGGRIIVDGKFTIGK